jgi:putative membrane protein
MTMKMALAATLLMSTAALAQTPTPPAPAMGAPTSGAGGTTGTGMSAPTSAAATGAAGTASLSKGDQTFVDKAASAGMSEVQEGQLALQKSSDQKVKDFAQKMIDDHTKLNDQLKTIAEQKGITLPTSLDSKDQKELDKLQALDGKKFDKAYMKDEVKDHETVLSLLQKEAKSGKDADLKNFAEQGEPIIQQHLDMAKADEPSGKKKHAE